MIISLSAKFVTSMVLLIVLMIKLAHAEFDDSDIENIDDSPFKDDDSYEPPEPVCPEEVSEFYKECRGALKSCTDCIQRAEKNCEDANLNNRGICGDCTYLFAGRCESAEKMCFGSKECGGGDMHCINFKCEHDLGY